MSVAAFFHPTTTRTVPPRGLRAALAGVLGRIAAGPIAAGSITAGPIDDTVLRAIGSQAPAGPPMRLRARWEAVTAADGTAGLCARWHAES
ncbi:hypothetical protein ACFV4F_01520 [Kitasatospora sp. NPDC059722]|uniref:hypothetical protein n=1 Tax=unclassified Kitasatospora TaxID=2633591 RepID=UPI0036953667